MDGIRELHRSVRKVWKRVHTTLRHVNCRWRTLHDPMSSVVATLMDPDRTWHNPDRWRSIGIYSRQLHKYPRYRWTILMLKKWKGSEKSKHFDDDELKQGMDMSDFQKHDVWFAKKRLTRQSEIHESWYDWRLMIRSEIEDSRRTLGWYLVDLVPTSDFSGLTRISMGYVDVFSSHIKIAVVQKTSAHTNGVIEENINYRRTRKLQPSYEIY